MAKTATRTQKKVEQAAGADGFQPEIPMTPAEDQIPIVNVTHREVRTWSQAKPMDEIGEEEFEDEEFEEPPAEENRFGVNDPIAKVLSEIAGSGSNWALQVNRLTDYERNQRTDPKSRRFVGTLSIPDADYLKEEKFLEDLQAKFARGINGNWFLLCVRRDNRNFAYLPPVCVEPPLPEVQAARAAENPAAVNIYPAPAQGGDLKSVIKQIEELTKLQASLLPPWLQGFNPLEHAPQSAAAAAPEQNKTSQLLDLVADDELVESVTAKIRKAFRSNGGSSEPERSWLDVLYLAVERDTLPKLINTFASQFEGVRNAQAPIQTRMDQHQASPVPNPPMPLPTLQDLPQSAPKEEEQIPVDAILINRTLEDCRYGTNPEITADFMEGFVDEFPEVGAVMLSIANAQWEQVKSLIIASHPQGQAVVSLRHAPQWFKDLQQALKEVIERRQQQPDGEDGN